MSDDAEKKPETEEPEEEDEEDLEKLQAEIKRMEEEAARITKETEELERKKDAKTAASAGSTDAASKTTGSGDAPSQDGYVVLRSIFVFVVKPKFLSFSLTHLNFIESIKRTAIPFM